MSAAANLAPPPRGTSALDVLWAIDRARGLGGVERALLGRLALRGAGYGECSPCINELAEATGFVKSTVQDALMQLRKRGIVRAVRRAKPGERGLGRLPSRLRIDQVGLAALGQRRSRNVVEDDTEETTANQQKPAGGQPPPGAGGPEPGAGGPEPGAGQSEGLKKALEGLTKGGGETRACAPPVEFEPSEEEAGAESVSDLEPGMEKPGVESVGDIGPGMEKPGVESASDSHGDEPEAEGASEPGPEPGAGADTAEPGAESESDEPKAESDEPEPAWDDSEGGEAPESAPCWASAPSQAPVRVPTPADAPAPPPSGAVAIGATNVSIATDATNATELDPDLGPVVASLVAEYRSRWAADHDGRPPALDGRDHTAASKAAKCALDQADAWRQRCASEARDRRALAIECCAAWVKGYLALTGRITPANPGGWLAARHHPLAYLPDEINELALPSTWRKAPRPAPAPAPVLPPVSSLPDSVLPSPRVQGPIPRQGSAELRAWEVQKEANYRALRAAVPGEDRERFVALSSRGVWSLSREEKAWLRATTIAAHQVVFPENPRPELPFLS